jgi:molecular chaperone DnaK (HSP70)
MDQIDGFGEGRLAADVRARKGLQVEYSHQVCAARHGTAVFDKMRALLTLSLFGICLLGCGCSPRRQIIVEDCTPIAAGGSVTIEALGLDSAGGAFSRVIDCGWHVPCIISLPFVPTDKTASTMTLELYRGTNQITVSNACLGKFKISGIAVGNPNARQIKVTFAISQSQILLSARDEVGGRDLQVQRVQTAVRK